MAKKLLDLKLIKAFVDKARALYEKEGTIEIDDVDDADKLKEMVSPVSQNLDEIKENGGMYVKAWVWVPYDAVAENGPEHNCAKCGKRLGKNPIIDETETSGEFRYCSEDCLNRH